MSYVISRSLAIQGQEPTATEVNGGEAGTVFTIKPGVTVTISNLTISGGNAGRGGGIRNEAGRLIINSAAVISNTATGSYPDGLGGGIYVIGAESVVTITNSLVSGNQATEIGGGVFKTEGGRLAIIDSVIAHNHATGSFGGGGIYDSGPITNIDEPSLVLDHVVLEENIASYGPGIYAGCSSVLIEDSTISANVAPNDVSGGGIVQGCSEGKMRILRSTISDNHAGGGAGISFSGERLEVTNSTISGNTASGQAAAIRTCCNDVQAILKNSTVTGNVGASGGALRGWFSFANSIIAWNGPENCEGTLTSQGYNLASDDSCNLFQASDLQGTDPLVGPLRDNGGPTSTHALQEGSPAIDAANDAACPERDQRGVSRPIDGNVDGFANCDIGAYEFDPGISKIHLPLCFYRYCPEFFDDFSNPSSGWAVGEDEYVKTAYVNGEYQILSKIASYAYLFESPACRRDAYVIEVDVRWDGESGYAHGLVLGISGDFDAFYLYDINSDFKQYRLLRVDGEGVKMLVGPAENAAINGSGEWNHLRVVRDGAKIVLSANGTVLGTVEDDVIAGLTGAGVGAGSYVERPVADARFDNFSMRALADDESVAATSGGTDEMAFTTADGRQRPVIQWRGPAEMMIYPQER